MVPGEDELATAATQFGALMMTAARSGGLTPESEPRKLLAAVRALGEATQALVDADYPRPEQIRALIDRYAHLHARVFAAMKARGDKNGVQ